MILPIAHNGQIFDLVPSSTMAFERTFRVVVDRALLLFDEDGEEIDGHLVFESLGSITFDFDGRLEARTRYGARYEFTNDLTAAVAFIVEQGRPCGHDDATGTSTPDVWECEHCGALYGDAGVLRFATSRT